MNRTTRTVLWTLALSLTLASVAAAAPTPEAKCTAAKLDAQRKRSFCVAGVQRTQILGRTANLAKCSATFDKQIAAADKAAAKKSTSCRWLDNGDGTATDLNSGLQWELKTDDGSIHDKDDTYNWNLVINGTPAPDGTAFSVFLGTLNSGASLDGVNTTGCFAGKCDWRMPLLGELRGIVDAPYPTCTINPCTTIPGLTASGFYWVRTNLDDGFAFTVSFANGIYGNGNKGLSLAVRAVRGGA